MMSESRTTTTTVNVTTANSEPVVVMPAGIKLNTPYITSVIGIIQIIQQILALICMGCASPQYYRAAQFLVAVAAICFILTLMFYIVHLLNVPVAFSKFPWLKAELGYSVVAAFMYFLASCIHLGISENNNSILYRALGAHPSFRDAYIVAGVVGLIIAILFGVIAFFLFKEYKSLKPSTTNGQPQP